MEEMREYGRRWAKYRGPHGLHTNSTGRVRARELTSEKDPDRFDKRKAHARKTLEWLRIKATISGYPWCGVTEEANTPPTVVLDPNALPKTRRTV
nr:hypothetical protein B0A51_06861 [Rachicladosporium sp. CCFEE 5018]